jgi:predicted ATPase/DNA-binding SARP family transcriptional activator
VPALLDRLWDDDPPSTAGKSIQKYVSNLRRILGPNRILSGGGYRLAVDDGELDAARLEGGLAGVGDGASPEASLERLEEVLALWRGEPYADLGDHLFLEPVRLRLKEARLALAEERLALMLACDRGSQVAVETAQLVDVHPHRERLWQIRVSALANLGRDAEALGELQRFRRILRDELGLDPGPDTIALEERILRHDPSLAPRRETDGNLPAPGATIIGRDAELDRLVASLDRTRLVTVVGTAGVGKTTLALEAARRARPRYPDGVWLVALAAISDPDRVIARTGETLGVPEVPTRSAADAVVEYLEQRRALLVFDNCEHVIDAAADEVGRILAAAPGITVLTTSRQPLGVGGETLIDLPTLPGPMAVRLLANRADDAGVPPRVLQEGAGSLAEIAHLLDGIPLALELAAARLRVLSPDELAKHLRDQVAILGSDRRDRPDRQRTLEAAVDWSYRLLVPAERRLLARLSVFRGGFILEAVDHVCGSGNGDMLPVLAALVDRSLVSVDRRSGGTSRYHLLWVIRMFAENALGDDAADLARRHAAWFTQYAAAPDGPQGSVARERLRALGAEYDNLYHALTTLAGVGDAEAGLGLAVSMADYWLFTGALREAQHWLHQFLAAAPDAPPALRTRAWLLVSDSYQPSSMSDALQAAQAALAESRHSPDRGLLAEALCKVGRLHAIGIRREPAVPLIEEASAIFEELGDTWGIADCEEALGVAFRGTAEDLDHFRTAVGLFREIGAESDLAQALFSMSYRCLIPNGRFDEAHQALDECAELSAGLELRHVRLHAQTSLGQLARLEHDPERAREILSGCLEAMREIGDRRCIVRIQTALARIALLEGDVGLARTCLLEAVDVGTELDRNVSTEIHELVDALALTAQARGQVETAARWCGAADAVLREQGLLRAPPDRLAKDEARTALEAGLGTDRARRLYDEGARISLDELVDEVHRLL